MYIYKLLLVSTFKIELNHNIWILESNFRWISCV